MKRLGRAEGQGRVLNRAWRGATPRRSNLPKKGNARQLFVGRFGKTGYSMVNIPQSTRAGNVHPHDPHLCGLGKGCPGCEAEAGDARLAESNRRLAEQLGFEPGDAHDEIVRPPSVNGSPPGQSTKPQVRDRTTDEPPAKPPIERFTFRKLHQSYPRLHPPIIDGLLRERETANIISVSKIGKSWLAYNLALCIVTGRPWLDRFATTRGRVLLIDNELHKPTLASRIPTVADALEIPLATYADALEVWPLRGNLRNIFEIGLDMAEIGLGKFKVIVIDAKYRMIPALASENDNAAETQFYNSIDAYAEMTGAAIINVHHSSKGQQGDKRITDVGAGAGAQSRAADCHLILREHEEKDVVVLDAAVRSFAPVEPVCLRWNFPLWLPDDGIDAGRLRGRLTVGEQRQGERDREGFDIITERLRQGSATTRQLRDCGIGKERLNRLLGIMAERDLVEWTVTNIRGNETREYRLRGT